MQRTSGAEIRDSRVNFQPDAWQKRLLDIVDNDESALVAAPTASGKTFICYYSMERVLRADNDGVVVYVSPSKALVNQVSAEVYARFGSKSYPNNANRELMGVFLREFNSAGGHFEEGIWRNAQVLVTIPHIFELLLFSPEHHDWVKRLKYVVFDEIHCIGEKEGGIQWERVMQLIPCPFLALSATVANPTEFHDWQKVLNESKSLKPVHFIEHSERWNDLYKQVYYRGRAYPLHPFACLNERAVRRHGLANDMTLTSKEACELYAVVDKLSSSEDNPEWSKFNPKTYFNTKHEKKGRNTTTTIRKEEIGDEPRKKRDNNSNEEDEEDEEEDEDDENNNNNIASHEFGCDAIFITKKEARTYEKLIKHKFVELVQSNVIDSELFQKIVLEFQQFEKESDKSSFFANEKEGEKEEEGVIDDDEDDAQESEENVVEESKVDLTKIRYNATSYMNGSVLYKLFKQLDKTGNLPCIVFNFSRQEIKAMLTKLAAYMKKQQWTKYYGTDDAAYRSKQIMSERMKKFNEAHAAWDKAGRMNKKEEEYDEMLAGEEEPEPPIDIADEIDMDFSFHSQRAYGQSQEEIDDEIRQLQRKGTDKGLIEALRRGIGLHHEASATRYRQAVEMLFRKGYLQVVFATGTLALGINMPCRCTVFTGDHVELNGLMFRQMSGRAGRRGYDLLGNVLFMDVPFPKISQLVASELPILSGELSFSPTTLLRTLLQIERLNVKWEDQHDRDKEKHMNALVNSASQLFQHPFFADKNIDRGVLSKEMLLYARFSVEFLLREGLIDEMGRPLELTSMATHLFEIEPANLMIVRLLRSGALHKYLKEEEPKVLRSERSSHLTIKLAVVLSHLLFRQRVTVSKKTYTVERRNHLPSKNCPILDPLPDEIQKVVEAYDRDVFSLYQQFIHSCSGTVDLKDKDLDLPYSKARMRPERFPNKVIPFKVKESEFLKSYNDQIIKYKSRSPISAFQGKGDYFTDTRDIIDGVRDHVVRIDYDTFPTLNTREKANSWLIDYLIHGQLKYLTVDNRLDPSEAYNLVTKMTQALDMMLQCLEKTCPELDDKTKHPVDIVFSTMKALRAELGSRAKTGNKD